MSKETYQVSKETYQVSKRDLCSKTYDKHLTARAQPAASLSLYAASGHHSYADPWAPGEGLREKEKRRVAARARRSTY